MNIFTRIAALCFFHLLLSTSAFSQGNLTPPGGPPAPTMKTLQQIEPRIDLQNAPTAAVTTTNAAYHFIINQPGSYYLSANLGVTKTNGIQINAEGVTLDLNGFEIARASGTGGNGIEIAATSHRASVRNGSLKGFAYGIRSILSVGYARACAFRDLAVSACTALGIFAGEGAVLEACRANGNGGTAGIFAGEGSTLTNCSASSNTGTYGIFANSGSSLTNCSASNNTGIYGINAGSGSSLTNCTASNNTGTYGILAGSGSSLTNCSASNNTSSAGTSAGIRIDFGCTITDCTAHGNTSTAATSTPTTGMGFEVGSNSTIRDCTASFNKGDGILISEVGQVLQNTASNNGFGAGSGAGIRVTGQKCRIDGNHLLDNDRGLEVTATRNLIVRNSARSNGLNYVIVAGNRIAQIVVPALNAADITGANSGSTDGFTAVDPWANFTF